MRSLRDIKKSIRHARIESKPEADEAILRRLLAELATVTAKTATPVPQCNWRAVAQSRIVQAAAAAVVVTVVLFVVGRPPHKVVPSPPEVRMPSAADLLTVGYLNAACRRGGLEAMDRQCEEAARCLGTRPERVSTRELIREFDEARTSKG